MSEKFEGPDRRKAPQLTVEMLKERAVRPDPYDHLFDREKGISFREKLSELLGAAQAKGDAALSELVEWTIKGPVTYIEMPVRYDLDDLGMNPKELRDYRHEMRRTDRALHDMLEDQRVRINAAGAWNVSLNIARLKGLGDAEKLDALWARYDQLQNLVVGKTDFEEMDHRIMTSEQKDAFVKDATALCRDVILFTIETAEARLS